MQVRTQRELIKTVAESWKKQYYNPETRKWHEYNPLTTRTDADAPQKIYNRLASLDLSTASATEINSILGNESWTNFICFCCGEYKSNTVEISEKFTRRKEQMCFDCIEAMHELVVKEKV